MTKIYTGSGINYGSQLPPANSAADGSLFFKTDDVNGQAGLYLFGFSQDITPGSVGEQVGQVWIKASNVAEYVLKSGDSMSGVLTVPGPLRVTQASGAQRILLGNSEGGGLAKPAVVEGQNGAITIGFGTDWTTGGTVNPAQALIINGSNNGGLTFRSGQVWHENNDGAGSALDAGVFAGNLPNFYLNTANHIGTVSVSRGGTGATSTVPGGIVYGSSTSVMSTSAAGSAGQLLVSGGTGAPSWTNTSSITVGSATSAGTAATSSVTAENTNANRYLTFVDSAGTSMPLKVDGDLSYNPATNLISGTITNANQAANANTLGGLAPSPSAVANTVLVRDGSGHVYAHYLNQGSPNSEAVSISQIMVTNGVDNFLRKASVSALATSLGSNFVSKAGDTMSNTLRVGGQGNVQLNPGDGGSTGYTSFYNASGVRLGYIGYASGANMNYVAENGVSNHAFSGTVSSTGNITAYASDGRLKKNIVPILNAVDKVLQLGGYTYDWDLAKCEEVGFKPEREHEHGLIAQDVEEVIPDAVAPAPFNNEYKTVRYDRLVALLMAAIGEQQKQINSLQKQIDTLKSE